MMQVANSDNVVIEENNEELKQNEEEVNDK